MVGDPVGDFIVRLANATAIKKASVSVPFSAFKMAIAEKLKDAGFLKSIEKKGKKVRKTMDIALKYDEAGHSAIEGVKRISKPGRRMYRNAREIVPVRYGRGALLLSTPKGVLTDKEARKQNIGGEALFEIW
ncbi:MAG: 30S ribosomal protein S8 [Patescibacteria group bacterium]